MSCAEKLTTPNKMEGLPLEAAALICDHDMAYRVCVC